MQAVDAVNIIRKAVQEVKDRGQHVVSVDALLSYLQKVAKQFEDADKEPQPSLEVDLAVFRAQHERDLAQFHAQQVCDLEMFRSVIGYGREALGRALLINGAAAAALLAFIGNIWTKTITPPSVTAITASILWFSFGVLVAALATGSSYCTQYFYSHSSPRRGRFFQVLCVLLVLSSYAVFLVGAIESYSAFAQHLSH